MPCLPHSTVLSKVNLFISVLALVLYCVGGLISQWITADFVLPMSPPVNVDVHMGLVESCKETSVMGNVISDDCSAKGARDFQKAATGLGFVGGVAGVIGLVMAVLNITVSRLAGRKWIKLTIAACSLASAGFMGGALALYGVNKKLQVAPPLPLEVDFDIGWAFIVSGISAGFYVILTFLALVDVCSHPDRTADMHSSSKRVEATVHYTNNYCSGGTEIIFQTKDFKVLRSLYHLSIDTCSHLFAAAQQTSSKLVVLHSNDETCYDSKSITALNVRKTEQRHATVH
ncbi:hypothetical protein RRG08_000599 [Elysia crispata]|uniref:Claudin n=1 Tax=Elysia crispata TaxID=231223 RepID=A0AAE0Y9Z0_9GAST|nr:hypothetical protein RRG08_000599 [Elysia crispata]